MQAVQCKMARAALALGVRELAELASVSPDTIARLERGDALQERTVAAVRAALEQAGVIFVDENGEGPGVRLSKHSATTGPIYVNPRRRAVLEHGAKSVAFLTLQEAMIEYAQLPAERQEISIIKTSGRSYTAAEIARFRKAEGSN